MKSVSWERVRSFIQEHVKPIIVRLAGESGIYGRLVSASSSRPPSYRVRVVKCRGHHRLTVYDQDDIQGREDSLDCIICSNTVEDGQWLY